MQKIVEFNKNLALTTDGNYDIFKYVHNISELLNKNYDNEIIDELLNLGHHDECNISYFMLIRYGIVPGKNDYKRAENFGKLLKYYRYIENEDYIITQTSIPGNRGLKYVTDYLLNPDSIKLYLMRTEITDKYCDYFLLIEKAIRYYCDYQKLHTDNQMAYYNNLIKQEEKRVAFLQNRIEELNKNKQQLIQK
jgi:phage anti-repressor protein